jgi:nucleotide-binding universal stress UspA family protein
MSVDATSAPPTTRAAVDAAPSICTDAMARPGKPGALRRILLATAGTPAGAAAVKAAAALARAHGASVRVASFYQPPIPYPTPSSGAPASPVAPHDRAAAAIQAVAVRRQLADADAECAGWPVTIEAGHAARCISYAADRDADLVIIGIGRRPGERPHGDRTAIGVAMLTGVPVLAVPPRFAWPPATMVIAVGLDDAAIDAARFASEIFPHPKALQFVHVRTGQPDDDDARAELQLERARAAFAPGPGTRVETSIRDGSPSAALIAVAQDTDADLVAGGLHGASIVERSVIRNAALHMMQDAECAVLLVPSRPRVASPSERVDDRADP